jgi:hypothetical protein
MLARANRQRQVVRRLAVRLDEAERVDGLGTPSSLTVKSSRLRSVSGFPCGSRTLTSTRTTFVPARNVGGC